MNSILINGLMLFFAFSVNAAEMNGREVCKILDRENGAASYLIDEKGGVLSGPIDLGTISLPSNTDDERYTVQTKYIIVVKPKNLEISSPWLGMGYGPDLIRLKDGVCRNAAAYRLVMRWVLLKEKHASESYNIRERLTDFEIADKFGYTEKPPNLHKFNSEIIGKVKPFKVTE